MANPGVYLEIDASELTGEIERLRAIMKPEKFEQAMYGIFQRTGGHVKTILKQDLPPYYYVTGGEINDAVRTPRVSTTFGTVGCTIPIVAPRKNIGTGYSATGYRRGWRSVTSGRYRIKARIVKSGESNLPFSMDAYGGMAPFRNMPSRLGRLAFARKGTPRLPIQRVTGIGIPQMPMNRAQQQTQEDILQYMRQRIEQRIRSMLLHGR